METLQSCKLNSTLGHISLARETILSMGLSNARKVKSDLYIRTTIGNQ